MTPDLDPPDAVRRLVEERTIARSDEDWPRADALRDELIAAGWEVQDGPHGSSVRPILAEAPDDATAPSLLADPAQVSLSVQVVAEDHPGDLVRFLDGLARHPPPMSWELVTVANAPSFEVDPLVRAAGLAVEPTVLHVGQRLGWADARTLGLRRSRGEVTVLLDLCLEPTGDFATPLLAAFDDPSVGLAGAWGVRSGDAREFAEAPPGAVDAVEGYCLAVRRDAARSVGGFDRRFRFYRHADLDFSFDVRDAGWRAVRTEPLPFERHEHRGHAAVDDDERDRLSKRNFYRFLKRWRDRRDLLLDAAPPRDQDPVER